MALVRSLVSALVEDQVRSLVGFEEFDPASLFANGEQGAWYDPSDLTTLYQDSAGTTPVTADGDPVGLNEDKSPNSLDLAQATSTSRPTYDLTSGTSSEEFDGTDDFLRNTTTNFTVTEFSVFVACMTNTPATLAGIFKAGDDALSTADKFILIRTGSTSGVSDGTYRTSSFTFGSGVPTVVEIHYSPTSIEFIQDGAIVSTLSGTFGSIPITNDIIVGSSLTTGQRWNGKHYGTVFIGRNLGETERQSTRQYLAQKAGVTL